jgi:hypothetical protein
MPEVVGESQSFRQILVKPKRARKRAGDLHHFEGVRQARAEVIPLVVDENLRLVREPPERAAMDDAVAVAAKGIAHWTDRLVMQPASTLRRIARIPRPTRCRFDCHCRRA